MVPYLVSRAFPLVIWKGRGKGKALGTRLHRSMSMRFRWHFLGSRNAARAASCKHIPLAFRSQFHWSTVKFGTRSFGRKRPWFQDAGRRWLGTTPYSFRRNPAGVSLSRYIHPEGTPCRFWATPRTQTRIFQCKPWRIDCAAQSRSRECLRTVSLSLEDPLKVSKICRLKTRFSPSTSWDRTFARITEIRKKNKRFRLDALKTNNIAHIRVSCGELIANQGLF